MKKKEILKWLKPLLSDSIIEPDQLLDSIGERIDEYAEAKAGQNETPVTRLERRKRYWHDRSRGILVGEEDGDEFEQEDATHMYGAYIVVVADMKEVERKNG